MPQLSDVLMNALDKPELSLSKISEEGIADMNLPDNILDDFDFNCNDDDDDDNEEIITSCNKVSWVDELTKKIIFLIKFFN